MTAKCDRCRFFYQPTYYSGECRFDPPRVVSDECSGTVTRFPIVEPDEWCGKFAPREDDE